MKIHDILAAKGGNVVTIDPDRTVADAIRLLVEHGIGSVVVMGGREIQGILTERDILRIAAGNPPALVDGRVGDFMTADLIVGLPTDDVQYVMEVMTRNRIRHLPVVEDGSLLGIISIGDVVNAMRQSIETENRYLRDYVQGLVH